VPPLFSRRWFLTTLLALAAVGVLIRLGIWQLDRLSQRRAFNASVIAQQTAAPLALGAVQSFARRRRESGTIRPNAKEEQVT
jgi:cytochrome oxidase assembly protein ShyY1